MLMVGCKKIVSVLRSFQWNGMEWKGIVALNKNPPLPCPDDWQLFLCRSVSQTVLTITLHSDTTVYTQHATAVQKLCRHAREQGSTDSGARLSLIGGFLFLFFCFTLATYTNTPTTPIRTPNGQDSTNKRLNQPHENSAIRLSALLAFPYRIVQPYPCNKQPTLF